MTLGDDKRDEALIKNIVNEALKPFALEVKTQIQELKEFLKIETDELWKQTKLYIESRCSSCKANEIFSDRENVKAFFKTEDTLNHHIEKHIEKEAEIEAEKILIKEGEKERKIRNRWLIGILIGIFLSKTAWDFISNHIKI